MVGWKVDWCSVLSVYKRVKRMHGGTAVSEVMGGDDFAVTGVYACFA
jgi:hypothetical protein